MFYDVLMQKRAAYRDRVQVHAFADVKGVPHILGAFDGRKYNFPGGGTEGDNPEHAANKEMREEAGYRITNARVAGSPKKYVMSDRWQDASLGKRGVRYKGVNNAIVHAELGERDRRAYNREGDAMRGMKLYPLEDVVNHMEWYSKRNVFGSAWDKEDGRAARLLRAELRKRNRA